MIEVLPWLGASTCETCTIWLDSLAGPALSLAAASIATEPSSATVAVSGLAVGASLTSLTVTVTVPVSDLGSAAPLDRKSVVEGKGGGPGGGRLADGES